MENYSERYDSMLSIRNILNILFIRKKLIISVFTVIVATVAIITFLMTPVYRSSSKIVVEREGSTEKALLFKVTLPSFVEQYDWINSEIEMITSYPVAARVLRSIYKDGFIEDDEFDIDNLVQFNRKVGEFQSRLTVHSAKNSNIIEICYDSEKPEQAAEIVKRVIATYISYRSELYSESETFRFFERQIKIADQKLKQLERRQADFKRSQVVLSPEEQKNILLTKLADYEKKLTDVRTTRMGKEAKLAVIKKQLVHGEEINFPVTETSDSPSREKYIAKLKGELLDLEMKKDQLLQKFTPEYEEVVTLNSQIKMTKEKISKEIQQIIEQETTSIQALKAQEQVLQEAIDNIHRDMQRFAEKEFRYNQISRGIDDSREVYSMLLKQREEARISLSKLQQGIKIKVINPAVIPTAPFKPRKKLNLLLAGFMGVFVSLSMAFFAEFFNHSFTYPEEIEKITGITVLGSVRDVNMNHRKTGHFHKKKRYTRPNYGFK